MVFVQEGTVTSRVQLPEADSSLPLALRLNTKARALSRGTETDRHVEEGRAGASGMTASPQDCAVTSLRHRAPYGRDNALVTSAAV